MSAVDGICLHQIVWSLEKVVKDIDKDITHAGILSSIKEQNRLCNILTMHREKIEQLITDIECA